MMQKKNFSLLITVMNEIFKIITETKDEVDFDKFSNFVPKIISDEQDELEKKLIDDFDLLKNHR